MSADLRAWLERQRSCALAELVDLALALLREREAREVAAILACCPGCRGTGAIGTVPCPRCAWVRKAAGLPVPEEVGGGAV